MQLRRQAHSVYRCEYHIVWIPRYRFKVLVGGVDAYLSLKLDEVRKWHPDICIVKRAIQPDHVHIVVDVPPRYSVADVVRLLKTNTSAALKKEFKFLRERYWGREGIWSVGYFVSTVRLDEATILRYVRQQERDDAGQAEPAER